MLQILNGVAFFLFLIFWGTFTSMLLSSKWFKTKITIVFISVISCMITSHYTDVYRYEYSKNCIVFNVESLSIEDFNDWFSGSQFKTKEIRDLETIEHLGMSNPKINHNVDRNRWEYSYNCDKYVVHFFIDEDGNCSDFNKVRESKNKDC